MPPKDEHQPRDFPRYVRILAVLHVLSYAIGPVGFVVLMVSAGILWQMRGMNDPVVWLVIAGISCPMLCALFRWWFVRWGRKHYPEK